MLLGTAGYLAPEQVTGDPVDGRADLFALGSILCEMLTGQRAFSREHTIDTLHAIVHDGPLGLPDRESTANPALIAIVRRLLEKSPANRFQTAADLAWALGALPSSAERERISLSPDETRQHSFAAKRERIEINGSLMTPSGERGASPVGAHHRTGRGRCRGLPVSVRFWSSVHSSCRRGAMEHASRSGTGACECGAGSG